MVQKVVIIESFLLASVQSANLCEMIDAQKVL